MGSNIYFVRCFETSRAFHQIKFNDKKRSFKQSGSQLCDVLEGAALTSCQGQFIFLTGGPTPCKVQTHIYYPGLFHTEASYKDPATTKVKRYDIKRDKLEDLPELNVGRMNHSSCTLRKTLYVIGGITADPANPGELNSIEKLDNITGPASSTLS